MKAFSIAVALLLAISVAPFAAAAQEPTTIERIIAQEKAKGLMPAAEPTPPSVIDRIIAQEEGRRGDPRIFGSTGAGPTVVVERSGGFHWGDAGIGAAAAVAAALIAAGGVALVRDSRRRHGYGEGRA